MSAFLFGVSVFLILIGTFFFVLPYFTERKPEKQDRDATVMAVGLLVLVVGIFLMVAVVAGRAFG